MLLLDDRDLEATSAEDMIKVIVKIQKPEYYDCLYYPDPPPPITGLYGIPYSPVNEQHEKLRKIKKGKAEGYRYKLMLKPTNEIDELFKRSVDQGIRQRTDHEKQINEESIRIESRIKIWKQRLDGSYQLSITDIEKVYDDLKQELETVNCARAADKSRESLTIAISAVKQIDRDLDESNFPATWEQTFDFLTTVCPNGSLPAKLKTFREHCSSRDDRSPVMSPDGEKDKKGIWNDLFGKFD